MKRLFLLTVILLLLPLTQTAAQTEPVINQMTIELWPDYDQPAVLVLITGFFADGTPNPTEVTLPLPSGADIHVVAYFTENDVLTDQGVDYSLGENSVTLSTPGTGFRLEYYLPYEALGNQRNFNYTWQADLPVNELTFMIQEPIAATNFSVTPTAVNVSDNNGLTYHTLPVQPVPAGTPYTVNLTYTLSSPQLTIESQIPADGATNTTVPQTAPSSSPAASSTSFLDTINWPLAVAGAGLLLIIVAVIWQIASSRSAKKRPAKPRRQAPAKTGKQAAKYCHECGHPLQSGDKFCRECGTAVKK